MNLLQVELNDIGAIHHALASFIVGVGECNVGVLTVTKPNSAGMSLPAFEWDFAGLRDRCLREKFKSAIWTAERQSTTRDWHVHALVAVGFDIQTGFPFEQVRQRDYQAVPKNVRRLWAFLREGCEREKYGRSELLPIDKRGAAGLVCYLSGRTVHRSFRTTPPPQGCGSWGIKDSRRKQEPA
jgi:hypothetical protein